MKKLLKIFLTFELISQGLCQKAVLCYWTYWFTTLSNSNPSLCTHLSYAFVDVDNNGALSNIGNMNTFKGLKNSYPNIKLLFSIGGAYYDAASSFKYVAGSATNRSIFALNVLNYTQTNNLDGVDVDWEYPDNQAANFVSLLKALYDLMNPLGYLVTIAVGADNSWAPYRYDIPNIAKYVDYVNLMTYDYHGTWETVTGINAPLYSSINTIYTVDKTTQDWISKIGSNKNKLLLGIPLYGPVWNLTSGNTGVGAPGTTSSISPLKYNQICKKLLNGWTRVFDNTQKVPYAFGDNQWVGYDDVQSIQEKINYLNSNGLGGAFFWEMSMDDFNNTCGAGTYPLMRLVKNAMDGLATTTTLAPGSSTTQVPSSSTTLTTTTQAATTNNISSTTKVQTTTKKITTTTKYTSKYVCTGAGLFKNPNDCSSFYNCGGVGYLTTAISCPSGLKWNDVKKYCDYPANVTC